MKHEQIKKSWQDIKDFLEMRCEYRGENPYAQDIECVDFAIEMYYIFKKMLKSISKNMED